MITMRDKIKGALLGGAIGDALGAPVETWTPEKIWEVHGGPVTGYLPPIGHKWFKPEEMPPGSTTDDTQLTVATMEGLIDGYERAKEAMFFDPYMDAIAATHIEASKHTIGGWGKTTTEAVRRLANGVHWENSGKTHEPNRGTGNGVCMKCSPLAFWMVGEGPEKLLQEDFAFNQWVSFYGMMTHYTEMGAHSGMLHTGAMNFCLWARTDGFQLEWLLDFLSKELWDREGYDRSDKYFCWNLVAYDLGRSKEHHLKDRMMRVADLCRAGELPEMTVDQIRQEFGNGSCYVYDSLPFSYAFFLRAPFSFGTILDTVNAGGDTDTNAKMVGEMIGAIQGIQFFEQPENRWALDGLKNADKLLALADRFCDVFDINVEID